MKVAIQGLAGSFHHEAAQKLLGQDIDPIYCRVFPEVFAAVEKGDAERGIVAVENNLHGSISAVYRLLARKQAWVCGELSMQIAQYLIGSPSFDGDMSSLQTVMSQAPALAQCELWLEKNLPNAHLEERHDTTESVQYVLAHPDQPIAAVAGRGAATMYGGKILAGPINDEEHNYTRFFLLSHDKVVPNGANKTSIILETGHQPGALYHALGAFADAGLNLSKLDSHPIAGDRQHYAFYIDIETGLDDQLNHAVFDTLRAQGCKVTILGTYVSGANV